MLPQRIFLLTIILYLPHSIFAQISFPKSGKTPESLVPKTHEILEKSEGDLNKDGKIDLVLVLKDKNEGKGQDSPPRVLNVYFLDENNLFKLVSQSSNFLLKYDEGGAMGDPYGSTAVQKGVIVVQQSGGSRERWSYTHRFRYQDGGFFLIGKTDSVYDSITGESTVNDSNLSTGKTEITTVDSKGKSKKRMETPGKKSLIRLEDFKIFE